MLWLPLLFLRHMFPSLCPSHVLMLSVPRGCSTPPRCSLATDHLFLVDYPGFSLHCTQPPSRRTHTWGIKWGAHDCNRVALLLSENAQLLTFLDEPHCIFGWCCFASFILWMVSIYTRTYASPWLSFLHDGKGVSGKLATDSQSEPYIYGFCLLFIPPLEA